MRAKEKQREKNDFGIPVEPLQVLWEFLDPPPPMLTYLTLLASRGGACGARQDHYETTLLLHGPPPEAVTGLDWAHSAVNTPSSAGVNLPYFYRPKSEKWLITITTEQTVLPERRSLKYCARSPTYHSSGVLLKLYRFVLFLFSSVSLFFSQTKPTTVFCDWRYR